MIRKEDINFMSYREFQSDNSSISSLENSFEKSPVNAHHPANFTPRLFNINKSNFASTQNESKTCVASTQTESKTYVASTQTGSKTCVASTQTETKKCVASTQTESPTCETTKNDGKFLKFLFVTFFLFINLTVSELFN